MDRLDINITARLIIGVIAGLWGGLAPLTQLLVLFMVLDIITGFIAAFQNKELSSEISYTGMRKKSLIISLVAMGAIIDSYAPSIMPFSIMNAISGFFALHEGLSIIENVGKGGVKIPDFLKQALEKLNAQ